MISMRKAQFIIIDDPHWRLPRYTYRCPVHIKLEREGGYSIIAATLPGCASQGETIPKALDNIKEALSAVLSVYLDDGVAIPWRKEEPLKRGWTRATVFAMAKPKRKK